LLWCFPGNIVRPKGQSSRLPLDYARGDKGRAEGHGAGECPRGGRVPTGRASAHGAGECKGRPDKKVRANYKGRGLEERGREGRITTGVTTRGGVTRRVMR